MKFQKTSQSGKSTKSKAITETSALPILSQEMRTGLEDNSFASSTPDAINLKGLRELADKATRRENWADVEVQEMDRLFDKVEEHLEDEDLKKVELPLLKLLKLVTSFENQCHELTWEICEILANIYNRVGNHEKCLTMLAQSLTLKKHLLPETDPGYILTLIKNANCLKELGETEDASELYKQARECKAESARGH